MIACQRESQLSRKSDMAQPFIVSVPHRLGKDEAVRRLKSGLDAATTKFGQVLSVQEEVWVGDRLQFRIVSLGQAAVGTIDVAEDHARLEVTLPWLLAQLADKIQRAVQTQGKLMLDKK
jgi:putative polyhydroxyalkanoic acid system protein